MRYYIYSLTWCRYQQKDLPSISYYKYEAKSVSEAVKMYVDKVVKHPTYHKNYLVERVDYINILSSGDVSIRVVYESNFTRHYTVRVTAEVV